MLRRCISCWSVGLSPFLSKLDVNADDYLCVGFDRACCLTSYAVIRLDVVVRKPALSARGRWSVEALRVFVFATFLS